METRTRTTACGYNAPGEDPYDDFLRWDRAQTERDWEAEEDAMIERWEAEREER